MGAPRTAEADGGVGAEGAAAAAYRPAGDRVGRAASAGRWVGALGGRGAASAAAAADSVGGTAQVGGAAVFEGPNSPVWNASVEDSFQRGDAYRSGLRFSDLDEAGFLRALTAELPIARQEVPSTACAAIAARADLAGVAAVGIPTSAGPAIDGTAGAAGSTRQDAVVGGVDGAIDARLAADAERSAAERDARAQRTAFGCPLPEIAGEAASGSGGIGVLRAHFTAEQHHAAVEGQSAHRDVAGRRGSVGVAVFGRSRDDGSQLLDRGVEVLCINCPGKELGWQRRTICEHNLRDSFGGIERFERTTS